MDSITNVLKHLHHSGNPLPCAIEPTCIFYKKYKDINPTYSIVLPIYNQEAIIIKNIKSILQMTGGTYELILIIDCCSDKTKPLIMQFVENLIEPVSLYCITVIESITPLFETSCDNIGFRLAKGTYFLEIQADMEMTQKDYNIILTKPFLKYKHVIGVSGRCCHDLAKKYGIGHLGIKIGDGYDHRMYSDNKFYVYETCNRGPLLLDAEKVRQLNYLDEENFYLDDSDHDLFARAYSQYEYICGYVPIRYVSPYEDGSTRKPKDSINAHFLKLRKERSNGGFLKEYMMNKYIPRDLQQLSLTNQRILPPQNYFS